MKKRRLCCPKECWLYSLSRHSPAYKQADVLIPLKTQLLWPCQLCTSTVLDLLPCSLLLSPLWDAWPPLEGPGVPAEWVEVASSWSRHDEGFWCQDTKEFVHSYHFSHKWGTQRRNAKGDKKTRVYISICRTGYTCMHAVLWCVVLLVRSAQEQDRCCNT